MEYASAEYTDMHFIYGVATSSGNAVEARRLFLRRVISESPGFSGQVV